MSGVNNFEVFNEDYQNLTSDINYSANTARQGGLVDGIADTLLHNKLYRQTSVMAAALAGAMASKNIDMLDSDLVTLIAALSKLQTDDEIDITIENAINSIGITPYIETLVDDVDAVTARTTLGANYISSLASTGYYVFPGGLIINWGITGSLTGNGGSSGVITFPMAFPTRAVFCTVMGTALATVGTNTNLTLATLTATNFSFINSYINDMVFVWLALGH